MKKFTILFVFLFAAFSLMKAADTPGNVTFNVDTTGGGFAADDRVFISGDLWGWPAPGDNAALELLDGDADGIFSVTLPICPNMHYFKFFKNTGWDNGEPVSADRVHTFTGGDDILDITWGVRPDDVVLNNPLPVTFEGSTDKTWGTFSLGANGDLCSDFTIVANPDMAGINTSANALQFVVNDDADRWAGAWTQAYDTLKFTEEYHTLTMMVYKTEIGRSALKVESSSNGGPVIELFATNTKVNEWELLSYDFSAAIGYEYPQFVIFPDFPEGDRIAGATVLLDNIAEAVKSGATFNVDTTGGGFASDDRVFISGSKWGWPMPGDNPDLELFDADGDGIFSITLPMCARFWEFKFFKNTSWDNGEPISSDRVHAFTGADETLDLTWGDRPDDVAANYPLPVTFEEGSNDMSWATFSLGSNDLICSDFSIVANPDMSGINTSANAIQFVVNDNADRWAGAWTSAYEPIVFTEEFHTLTMMVNRSDIGRSALKVENSSNGGPVIELFATNTVTDEWELLTYKFTDGIGFDYPRFVFFPDFPEGDRVAGATVLVDNIAEAVQTEEPYAQLYVIGDACSAGWNIGDALPMTADETDPTIFTWEGDLTASEIKFETDISDWCNGDEITALTQGEDAATATAYQIRENADGTCSEPDNKWIIGEAGTYLITINLTTETINFELQVGIEKVDAVSNVSVYPNPVTNELNVTFASEENATVIIYNSLGQKVEEVIVEGNRTSFDVSSYVNGLYFVKVNNAAIVKFVK